MCVHTNLTALCLVWANFDQISLFIAITEKPIAKHAPFTNFSAINLELVFDELSDQNVVDTDASLTQQLDHTHSKNVSSKWKVRFKINKRWIKKLFGYLPQRLLSWLSTHLDYHKGEQAKQVHFYTIMQLTKTLYHFH